MRIKLDQQSRMKLFTHTQLHGISKHFLAEKLQINTRTLLDWRRGKYTLPKTAFDTLLKLTNTKGSDYTFCEIDPAVQRKHANRKSVEKFKMSGRTLATPEGRRRGGVNSYNKRKNNPTDIFARKRFTAPPLDSLRLAECIGILIGDGSTSAYQVTISLNSVSDAEYITYVCELMTELFGRPVKKQQRQKSNCTNLVISSVELTDWLVSLGIVRGNKIRGGLGIPSWILQNKALSVACIRGIFDTDGGVFLETHHIKQKTYSYLRMSFVSASPQLLTDIRIVLADLGLQPKHRYRRINLEQFTDIEKYFTIVGSSNPKHIERFRQFGGVA